VRRALCVLVALAGIAHAGPKKPPVAPPPTPPAPPAPAPCDADAIDKRVTQLHASGQRFEVLREVDRAPATCALPAHVHAIAAMLICDDWWHARHDPDATRMFKPRLDRHLVHLPKRTQENLLHQCFNRCGGI
jgi:hypothetical protein